jgi:multidrug efflux pump subunit AcrB
VQLGGDGGDSNQQLSFFFVQLLPGTEGPIDRYRRLVEDVVKPRIESVPGVAQVEIQGGPPDDVRITLDLARAAALGIGIPDIARQAASATNVSAGQLDVSPCGSRTSRRSRCGRRIAASSLIRTAIPRSACASCVRPVRTCSARSKK